MSDQIGLELWPRQHDLPPRWDGLAVEWGERSDTANVFICPPPKPRESRCEYCRSERPRLMCLGRIFTAPGTVLAVSRGRLSNGHHFVANLAAFRCPDCRRDYVIDGLGPDAQQWTLDETDYTDDGSWDVAHG